nr:hypothetical protein [Tanacetum cinerariifolium]
LLFELRLQELVQMSKAAITVRKYEAGVTLTNEQNDFLFANASRMEEIKELSANICLMAKIQPTNFDSDAGPSNDSTFLNEAIYTLVRRVIHRPGELYVSQASYTLVRQVIRWSGESYVGQASYTLVRTKLVKQDTSNRSENDTHAEDVDIKPVNDKEPMAEADRNITHDSTIMCHRGGEIDQNAKKCQDSCPLLDPSFDNMTTEFSNQYLKSESISLKKTIAQLQKDFSRMEAHCVNMELKYQNKALKDGQHGQILNETSNEAKIKKETEVLETINIELEHSVAKLLAENEKLYKDNENLKQIHKDLYDSIKKTRVQTKEFNDLLIAQVNSKTVENADLKAQIQETIFANVSLKNELRKVKGNSMYTEFENPSILMKLVLQPSRNQSVVRQPNAFKSERPNFENHDLPPKLK